MWKRPETILELLKRNVTDFGDREAFISVSQMKNKWVRHTWREMDAITDKVAGGLMDLSLKKGQKVAFMNSNCAECYYCYLGVHKAGGVFVPINVRLVDREVEYLVNHCDAEYLILGSQFSELVNRIRERAEKINTFIWIGRENEGSPPWATTLEEILKEEKRIPNLEITPEDVADLIYTTGTTGLPKGVVLTEANKVANGCMNGLAWDIRRKHHRPVRLQTSFPFFTSTGLSSTMMSWLYYGYILILEEKFDTVGTLETIEREKTTCYVAAPSMLIFVLDHPRFKEFDTSSLQVIGYGGSPVPEELIRRVYKIWPEVKLINIYGLTEGGVGGIQLEPADALRKMGSIGLPWAPDQEGRIVNEKGENAKVNEPGEIVLRGPNVMKEYYKNPEATREALRDGWLHTGDIGYYDEDGYFFYTDRMKDMIVRGGFNIYSIEVENALYEHSAVKQCAVIAKPHPKLGEDVLALVVLFEGKEVSGDDLINFTSDKLADYKRPREVVFVKALPTNAAGKVDKKALRGTYKDLQTPQKHTDGAS